MSDRLLLVIGRSDGRNRFLNILPDSSSNLSDQKERRYLGSKKMSVMRRGFLVWDWDCMEGRGDEQTGLHHCDEERVPCLGV